MNSELMRRVKRFAAKNRRTFTQVVEEAVTRLLDAERKLPSRKTIELPVVGDPRNKGTHEDYQRIIEQMYDEEIEHLMRGSARHDPA